MKWRPAAAARPAKHSFAFKANHFERKGALIYVFQKDGISLLYGHDSGFFPEGVW